MAPAEYDSVNAMKAYRNRSGDAGIAAYETGPDWIRIRFVHGGTYEYTSKGVGNRYLRRMQHLAAAGEGLTTFINIHPAVRDGYARRWD